MHHTHKPVQKAITVNMLIPATLRFRVRLTLFPLFKVSSGSDHGENLILRHTPGHTIERLRIHDGFDMHEFMKKGSSCVSV
jgi:hypothetical protein